MLFLEALRDLDSWRAKLSCVIAAPHVVEDCLVYSVQILLRKIVECFLDSLGRFVACVEDVGVLVQELVGHARLLLTRAKVNIHG